MQLSFRCLLNHDGVVPLLALLLLLPLYSLLFGLPMNGSLGDDYSYFFPQLLDGYYWYLNNGFSVPWFTPAFCGGLPSYPNPQNLYYSLPQWLTIWLGPHTAIWLTQLVMVALGFCGMYLLLRKRLRLSQLSALLGAALLMFNGFFAIRMAIGHLAFHGVMLLPWLVLLLTGARWQLRQACWRLPLAALIFAYLIYSGMLALLLPVVIALVLALSVVAANDRELWRYGLRLLMLFGLGGLLASSKLVASMDYLASFPRDGYSLPGISDFSDLLLAPFHMLFLSPESVVASVSNLRWAISAESFNYGLSIVPLLLLLVGVVLGLRNWRGFDLALKGQRWRMLIIAVLLLTPLLLNYYQPQWNALLKSLPIIGQSSNNMRWMIIYFLPVLIAAMWVLNHYVHQLRYQAVVMPILLVVAIMQLSWSYQQHPAPSQYDSSGIERAYQQAKLDQQTPRLEFLGGYRDAQRQLVRRLDRNDLLTQNGSIINCYEPMFGYLLEWLPADGLRTGSIYQRDVRGNFNFSNPSCYLFGEENQCRAGDPLSQDQSAQLQQLISYQSMSFNKGGWQKVFDTVSLLTLLLLVSLMIFALWHYYFRRELSRQ